MSIECLVWAVNLAPVPYDSNGKPSSPCAFVLVGLANHADPTGRNAFPSVDTLVRYTRLAERTVRESLKRLRAEEIITPSDVAIIAANIKRADQRPRGYDLAVHRIREDLTGEQIDALVRSNPLLAAFVAMNRGYPHGVQQAHPVAVNGVQQAHPVTERGAAGAPRGVQQAHPNRTKNQNPPMGTFVGDLTSDPANAEPDVPRGSRRGLRPADPDPSPPPADWRPKRPRKAKATPEPLDPAGAEVHDEPSRQEPEGHTP